MVLRPAGTNASFPKQVFGGNSPVPAGLLSSDCLPAPRGNLAVPSGGLSHAPTPLQTASAVGGGLAQGAICESCTTRQDDTTLPSRGGGSKTYQIPGVGTVTDTEKCGKPVHRKNGSDVSYACTRDPTEYKKTVAHSCDGVTCPICFKRPLLKASNRIASQIRGYQERASRLDPNGTQVERDHYYGARWLNHYVISPPPGKYAPDTPKKVIIAAARRIAKKAGLTGGFMFPHTMRIKHDMKPDLKRDTQAHSRESDENKELKFWDLIREKVNSGDKLGKWAFYSPHVHAEAFGYLPDQNTPEEKAAFKKLMKGWIVSFKRHVKTPALDSCFDGQTLNDPIAEMAYYALSHALVEPGTQMYSAFGFMADLRKDGGAIPVRYDCTCPKCNAPVAYGRDTPDGYRFEDGFEGDQYRMRRVTAFARWVLIKGIDTIPERARKRISARASAIWGPDGPPVQVDPNQNRLCV